MPAHAPKPDSADLILREINTLVEELAGLAESDISGGEFYRQLLQRTVFVLSANGAAIWTIGAADSLHLTYQEGLSQKQSKHATTTWDRESARIQSLAADPQATLLPALPDQGWSHWVVAAPIRVGDRSWGILTVHGLDDLPLAVKQGFLRFVEELAGIASTFENRCQFKNWQLGQKTDHQLSEFCLATHHPWSVRAVAYEIANEGRQYLQSDRLSVVLQRGKQSQLLAISGVESIHNHSDLVRKLELLVQSVIHSRQPFYYDGSSVDLPPQIEEHLHNYLDEVGAREIIIIPLQQVPTSENKQQPIKNAQPFAAIVCEQFHGSSMSSRRQQLQTVCQHSTIALGRAIRLRGIPLLGLLAQHPRLYSALSMPRWPIWATVMTCCLFIASLLIFVKTDFNIVVRGELQPERLQHIFAPMDGLVDKIMVNHGQYVEVGANVILLKSTDLDLESQRVRGELRVAQKELLTIQTEQLQFHDTGANAASRFQELSAQELTLIEQLENLKSQISILNQQHKDLRLTSPLSGQVLTWDLEATIAARPVQRGNILLTVGDLEGPWVSKFKVPDESMGHVLDAYKKNDGNLQLSFVSATEPGKSLLGQVQKVAITSQIDPVGKTSTVLVEASFDESLVKSPRPGATVVGKINCGRRSVGYVWLHELYEEIQRHIF